MSAKTRASKVAPTPPKVSREPSASPRKLNSRPASVVERSDKSFFETEHQESNKRVANSKYLFETQQIAPSPGTTYYQLVVEQGQVVLNDWPRQRFSQKWSRDGALNPGKNVYTFKEFIQGENREQFVSIFGQELYDQAIEVSRKQLE